LKTFQIKHIVNAAVIIHSAYDTCGIPTLDDDVQTLEQKLSGSRFASGSGNAATNVPENVAASFPSASHVSTVCGTKQY